MAFRTNKNVSKILRPKPSKSAEDKTGVYKITCNDCDSLYIGQTGRSFIKRFKEHLPKKDFSKTMSSYARHLMDRNHNYTDFTTNFQPLHICKKGRYMSAVEEFEIYKAFKNKNTKEVLLNEQLNFQSNSLYDTAIRLQNEVHSARPITT